MTRGFAPVPRLRTQTPAAEYKILVMLPKLRGAGQRRDLVKIGP
jgi:hypothetical protein